MKAVVYAILRPKQWSWEVTLDIRIDYAFWFEQYGGTVSIVVLGPSMSLGQAHEVKRVLNREGRLFKDEQALLHLLREKVGKDERILKVIADLRVITIKYEEYVRRVNEEVSRRKQYDVDDAVEQQEGGRNRAAEITTSPWRGVRSSLIAPELQLDMLEQMEAELQGRSLTREEFVGLLQHAGLESIVEHQGSYLQAAYLRGRVALVTGLERVERARRWWLPALKQREAQYRCRRCGSGMSRMYATDCPQCGGPCLYCEACLTMGRQQQCSLLIRGLAAQRSTGQQAARARSASTPAPLPPQGGPPSVADDGIGNWGLSPAQGAAVRAALAFLASPPPNAADAPPRSFLIWAVTGAGKTEMIFPLIEAELARGGTVLMATPRRDVVLELRPRLQRAFPDRTIVTLYGGSEDRWNRGDITLATTHQLMRFHRAFDLIIIDELDAFPYHNNPELQYAAGQVCKPQGTYIFLSATPPTPMQRAVKRNQLPHVRVPVRFHRHPLPVPRLLITNRKNPLPLKLKRALEASVHRGAQLFVFVPKIKEIDNLVTHLISLFPNLQGFIDGTSSQDPDRAEKVLHFRDGRIRILVTTTILERGVTVPKTDVYILRAESALFDEASLVQMAGRAGRSKDDPNGIVYFVSAAKTNAQAGAIQQIRLMNRLARKKGFLLT